MENLPKPIDDIENKEKVKPVYTALFVKDIKALLEKYPPKHTKVFGHHSTIAFKPASLDGIKIGDKSQLKIIGRVSDSKGDALLVENSKSNKKHPHITLSCAEGVPPVYSDKLIEKAIASNSVEYFEDAYEVSVVEGYSDGKTDVITTSK